MAYIFLLILYVAGMAPSWGMMQMSNLISTGSTQEDKTINFIFIAFWPLMGIYAFPKLIKKVKTNNSNNG
ncbi:hypothetical protein PR08_gp24 [Idiomarinaceae phage Phi1M2-2]|uniref:hypothetical protein n=1 Tax=Idiomarinaceae phage Phi1M2-2 TaxID=1527515 RepID=UPI0004F69E51|nr:hypothetical protein PR08_gp24 [Idiomarinaceae phage Phi1M2-2]AIM40781.1 hypothetical protein M22_024 [Idiomarinaceae phage Phi1M2-2]